MWPMRVTPTTLVSYDEEFLMRLLSPYQRNYCCWTFPVHFVKLLRERAGKETQNKQKKTDKLDKQTTTQTENSETTQTENSDHTLTLTHTH